MAAQLFNNDSARAQTVINLTMSQIYDIVSKRLEYHNDSSDPDATCQAVCCEIEKAMGIYPNVPGVTEE